MKSYHILILVLFISFLSQSCFNYVNLTEAQSLGKGNNSIQVEGEFNVIVPEGGLWGSLELLYTHGVNDNYDAGVFLNTNTGFGIHNKYQVYDSENIDLAVGLDAKILLLSASAWEFFPNFYYTHKVGKVKFLANPSLRFGNDFSAGRDIDVIFSPSITLGMQFGEKPFRMGYVIGRSPFSDALTTHAFGLSYNINF